MALSRKGTFKAIADPANMPKPGEGIAKTFGAVSGALQDYATSIELKAAQANQEFLDNINKVDLNPANSSMVIDQTMSMRDTYLKTKDPIEKQKILNDISSLAQDVDDMEVVLESINKDNISNTFSDSEEGREFSRIVSDPDNIEIVDGVPGITINGQFMDKDKLSSYVGGMKMDNSFSEVMLGLEFDQQEDRKDLGDDYSFDVDDVRFRIRTDITKNANLRSLFEDTLYAGRNFKSDLVEKLGNSTYYDLGITDEMLKDSDVNLNDGVDVEDIDLLVNYLKSNQIVLRDMLTDYYTDILAQKFDAGKTPTSVVSTSQSSDFNDEGVFVPSDNVKQPQKEVNVQAKEVKDRIRGFRSRIKRDYMDESKVSDEDIQAYFNKMKGRLNTEIFNTGNFQQWLRDNNKDIPLQ